MNATQDTIDRISPTRLPQGRVVMHHRWLDLLFLHWEVSVEDLQRLLPLGLTVDTYEGKAYVGLVPFTMYGTRPVGLPAVSVLSNFHEINVRTYVHYEGGEPGVWFFSLDAANAAAVRIARGLYKLPYYFANMELVRDGEHIRYRSERLWPQPTPAVSELTYVPVGESYSCEPGTLDHFLIERYILYSEARGRLYRGRVHHVNYPVQSAKLLQLDESLIAASKISVSGAPQLIHYSPGVDVRVFPLERVG